MKIVVKTFTAIVATISFTSCFTGIESTPKITADDLRRERIVTSTPEQEFGALLAPDSLVSWSNGRPFLVTDDKIKLVFRSTGSDRLPSPGDTINFAGLREVASVMGTPATAVDFVNRRFQGDTLTYRLESTPEEVKSRQTLTVPFTVDVTLVAKADSLLKGKTLYVMTSYWYDKDLRQRTGRKFVKVDITGVRPGNGDYPLCVDFNDEEGKPQSLLMTTGTGRSSTRNFSTLFSLTDPRLRYPTVSDENWTAIVNGKVRPDMTRDEARLALGAPKEVIHGHNYSATYERWIYPNGAYLVFEDGLLHAFRL